MINNWEITQNWVPLKYIWFSHLISFEILLLKPWLESQNCSWFGSSNFSTGKSCQQQNKPIEHTVQGVGQTMPSKLLIPSGFSDLPSALNVQQSLDGMKVSFCSKKTRETAKRKFLQICSICQALVFSKLVTW